MALTSCLHQHLLTDVMCGTGTSLSLSCRWGGGGGGGGGDV